MPRAEFKMSARKRFIEFGSEQNKLENLGIKYE